MNQSDTESPTSAKLLLLAAAGVCGISTLVLLAQQVQTFTGDSLASLFSLIIALGLGAFVAHRLGRWLWVIELGIGVCSVGVVFAANALPSLGGAASFVLVPPAFLVGCSIPLLAARVGPRPRLLAAAHALHWLGAGLCVFVVETWLIHAVGLRVCLLGLAGLNFLVAVALRPESGEDSSTSHGQPRRAARHMTGLALASASFAALLIIVSTISDCVLGPSPSTPYLVLGVALLGAALGSALWARLQPSFGNSVGLALIGVALVLGTGFFAKTHAALASTTSAGTLGRALMAVLAGPFAVAFGGMLPAVLDTRRGDPARATGELVFACCVGVALGVVAYLGLLPLRSYGDVLLGLGVLTLVAAVVAAPRGALVAAVGPAVIALGGVLWLQQSAWDEELLLLGQDAFASTRALEDSKQNRSTEVRRGRTLRAINWVGKLPRYFVDGQHTKLDGQDEEVAAAFGALFAPKLDRALVLDVGSGIATGVLGSIFEGTDALGVDPGVRELLPRMGAYNLKVSESSAVRLLDADPLQHLHGTGQPYSLVVNTVSVTDSVAARMHSLELLQAVRGRLAEGGVYVTQLQSEGSGVMLRTLSAVFEHCWVGTLRPGHVVLVCSVTPISLQNADLSVGRPELSQHVLKWLGLNLSWLRYGLVSTRGYDLENSAAAAVNTLDRPVLELDRETWVDAGLLHEQLVAGLDPDGVVAALGTVDPMHHMIHLQRLLGRGHPFTVPWGQRYAVRDEEFVKGLNTATEAFLRTWVKASASPIALLELGNIVRSKGESYNLSAIGKWWNASKRNKELRASQAGGLDLSTARPVLLMDPEAELKMQKERGIIHVLHTQMEDAIDAFSSALAIRPDPTTYNNRAATLIRLGRAPAALRDLAAAIELDPKYVGAYRNRGRIYAGRKDFRKALENYDQCVKLGTSEIEVFIGRGMTRAGLKNFKGAVEDFTTALQVDPNGVNARFNRAAALHQLEEKDRAIADLEAVLELLPPKDKRVRGVNKLLRKLRG